MSSSGQTQGETIHHRGRRFKRNHVSSSAIIHSAGTTDTCKTQPSPFPPMKTSNPSFPSSSCSSSITHASTPRPLSLTPAHPPHLTSKGRPMSAKGRPRSGSYIATEIKSGFSLKQSQPLPPIGSTIGLHGLQHQPLYEVDSAVDLEYNSVCCTPDDSSIYPISVHVREELVPYPDHIHPQRGRVEDVSSKHVEDAKIQNEVKKQPLVTASSQQKLSYESGPINVAHSVHLRKSSGHSALAYYNETASHSSDKKSSKEKIIQLCLKLPSGERVQAEFNTLQRISELVSHAQQHCDVDLSECEVATNGVPRQVIRDWNLTLEEAGITVRTLLYLSTH